MNHIVSILKALSDKNRLRMFCALTHYDELCACQITELIQVTGATTSRHLSILVNAGLLKSRKDGRWINYSLDFSCKNMDGILYWLNPELQSSGIIGKDLETLKQITAIPREDLCRKQRGEACCPIKKQE